MVHKSTLPGPGGSGGITSLNGQTGVVDLTSTGNTITITEVGNNINLEASGGSGEVCFSLDGQGSAISTSGTRTWYLASVPFAGTITAWNLVADQSGSIVIDVWKANASVPTVTNTITASSLPTLSSAQSAFAGSISGWTTSVAVGDVFAFHINSASTVTTISLTIQITAS